MATTKLVFTKTKVNSSFTAGFVNTFRAFSLIGKSKGLLFYFVIPFILNIAILTAIFYFSYTSVVPWAQSFLAGDQWYMQFIRFVVSPVFFILLSVITVMVYSIVGGIITAPFLDLISSETEQVLGTISTDESFSLKEFISDILRSLFNTIRLLILVIAINIVLLMLNIVPGGSFIYAFCNFLSALFFYGFQFYDYPLERKRYSFNDKLKITWKFKWSVFGTGLAFFMVSFIPVIGFLGLNLCTIGATLTYAEDIKPSLS